MPGWPIHCGPANTNAGTLAGGHQPGFAAEPTAKDEALASAKAKELRNSLQRSKGGRPESSKRIVPLLTPLIRLDGEVNPAKWDGQNLAHINIGRLLDREHDDAGDRLGRQRELVAGAFELRFHLWIGPAFSEVRPDEPWRNDRHPQLLSGLLGDC